MSISATEARRAALPAIPRYLVEQAERAIDRADAKAAALGAVAIAVLPVLARFAADAHSSGTNACAQTVFIVGALGWLAGIVSMAAAILPRLRRAASAESDQLLSFCDFPDEFDVDRLCALVDSASADAESWLLAQGHVLSRIAMAKFRLIRTGMSLLAAGGLFDALGMLVS